MDGPLWNRHSGPTLCKDAHACVNKPKITWVYEDLGHPPAGPITCSPAAAVGTGYVFTTMRDAAPLLQSIENIKAVGNHQWTLIPTPFTLSLSHSLPEPLPTFADWVSEVAYGAQGGGEPADQGGELMAGRQTHLGLVTCYHLAHYTHIYKYIEAE